MRRSDKARADARASALDRLLGAGVLDQRQQSAVREFRRMRRPTAAAALAATRALLQARADAFYAPTDVVPLVQKRSARLQALWDAVGATAPGSASCRFPQDVCVPAAQRREVAEALGSAVPRVAPNALCVVAEVTSGELAGQLKLVAGPGGIPRGSLLPFVLGEQCLESELDGSSARNAYACDLVYSPGAGRERHVLVLHPDLRGGTPYANDFCGW